MNDQLESTTPRRGRGRPRKVRPAAEAPASNPVAPLVTDRRGAAKIINKSESTVKRLEKTDPLWPKPFVVGAYETNYLISSVHEYVLRKAREAQNA
ncbi:hypothetical protein BTH42_22490 [Burkholderia sp. SRS-W-2-2016]|uniref:hypothetical protein n=1 Tax=Burkholderia sp. SRS-W-2-2016 TaxID=1926878 RepID=UPI00094ACD36|nr:hypothetical protein [Burkholderia sp. SRS-W-2-2016]OLL29502.1 hypothetical protein BTH42_22490 [Burkholderia sp. SRS-W-2-2016]